MKYTLALVACAGCRIADVHFMTGDAGADAPMRQPGDLVWARSLSTMLPLGMVSGPGGIVVAGYTSSTADLGGQLLTSAGGADMIIASFTEADATHLYSVRHGDVGNEYAWVDTLDTPGAPFVMGVSYGTVDLGQGQVAGGGGAGSDGYIGRYAGGTASWVKRIVGPGEDKILWTAPGPSSTIYAAGWFEDMPTFDSATLTSAGGRDGLLVRLHMATAVVDLRKQWGGTGRDELTDVETLGTDIIVAGFFDDTIDFGGTAAPITATGGAVDFFVARLTSDGNGVWAVTYGGTGEDREVRLEVDAAGDIYICGSFENQLQLGTYTLDAVGMSDPFIAKLHGSDGSVAWATSLGSTGLDTAGRIAIDNRGHLAFDGQVNGALDGFPTLGGYDAVIAELDTADGSQIWRHIYSTSGDDRGGGVTYLTTGDILAGLSISGPYDFGTPMLGAPNPVGVMLRIAP